MKWSLKLGRILGIDVYLHFTFLLLLMFVALTQWGDLRAAVWMVLFFVSLFACVLLHEFGHALAARRYGIRTHDIILLPIGGVARLERMPDKPGQELVVAVAGPLVNLVIAAGLFVGLTLRNGTTPNIFGFEGGLLDLTTLLRINVLLMLFNLLPAFPMDGGRVLRALLAMRTSYARATRIAATIGQAMAALFGFIGLMKLHPLLILIALFVWVGASQEAAAVELKSTASGARVRDAMLTHFRTLAPGHTLGDAARHLLAGSQQDFPVVEEGRLAGILLRKDLFQALQERGETLPVSEVMRQDFLVVSVDELLESALGSVQADRATTMAVMENGRFAGLLTAENVGEFFMIRAALEKNRRSGGSGGRGAPAVPPVINVYPAQARRAQ